MASSPLTPLLRGRRGEPPGASGRFEGSKRKNLFGEFPPRPSPPKEERCCPLAFSYDAAYKRGYGAHWGSLFVQMVWDKKPPSTRISVPVTKLLAFWLAR